MRLPQDINAKVPVWVDHRVDAICRPDTLVPLPVLGVDLHLLNHQAQKLVAFYYSAVHLLHPVVNQLNQSINQSVHTSVNCFINK